MKNDFYEETNLVKYLGIGINDKLNNWKTDDTAIKLKSQCIALEIMSILEF